jgi:hypothetical protein
MFTVSINSGFRTDAMGALGLKYLLFRFIASEWQALNVNGIENILRINAAEHQSGTSKLAKLSHLQILLTILASALLSLRPFGFKLNFYCASRQCSVLLHAHTYLRSGTSSLFVFLFIYFTFLNGLHATLKFHPFTIRL